LCPYAGGYGESSFVERHNFLPVDLSGRDEEHFRLVTFRLIDALHTLGSTL